MSNQSIPLVDLKAAHAGVENEVREGFERVLGKTAFILGEDVTRFEEEFARFVGARHCIGVANGTDALELALRAVGVGTGDEVIVPANTFIATALAVVRAGATPVLVDCDDTYMLIDPSKVAQRISPRTRAIMPVHLYGQMAPMRELVEIATDAEIVIVEDAAQCQGAKQDGTDAGSFGVAAGTSFYPGKNLGAYGDAGAVITNDDNVDARVQALRAYGSVVKYHHPEIGFNSRLDTLQAVVLRAKLARLAKGNAARRAAAERYDAMLAGVGAVKLPATRAGNEHVFHLYVIRVAERDRVLSVLNEAGVGAGIHYPTPLHLLGAFKDLGHARGEFPIAEACADEILSLPLFPEITPEQQERVVDVLTGALG